MRYVILSSAAAGWILTGIGCRPAFRPAPEAWDSLSQDSRRERVVQTANDLSKNRTYRVDDRRFSSDCSGFVGAVLLENGIDVFGGASVLQMEGNGVRLLYEYIVRYGTVFKLDPKPGDLVFFSNTVDRNHDHRAGGAYTHVGIVERMGDDGTITFIHRMRGRVIHSVLNLASPDRHEAPTGNTINTYLRQQRRRDRPGTKYLAGALFTAFGSLTPENRSSMTPPLSRR